MRIRRGGLYAGEISAGGLAVTVAATAEFLAQMVLYRSAAPSSDDG